ncbi:hypothetical protein ABEB36_007828 [Hypothenemus hampei]|uniref:Regulator of microtubule dynamics protein 1 n=1 Tax=Hypothenemus hampei TaxID=57062 RepID=A0ABD1EYD9_HYPHA
MPVQHNFSAFLGAAVLGVIGAAGMYLIEQYRRDKMRNVFAKDLARLEKEMTKLKLEVQQLQSERQSKRSNRLKKSDKQIAVKANSILSATTDDYLSASNFDSSDLEFFDLSDDDTVSLVDSNASALETLLKDLDQKLDLGNVADVEEALQRLEDLCLEYPNNPDLLYRIGKAHHKVADASNNPDFIRERLTKGIEACKSALNVAPEHAEVHKWYAVLIGSRTNFVPIQEKLNEGRLFKFHVDKAVSINPDDYSLHYMLGRFSYDVAGLKWYEKKVAAAFFGEPPNATYEEACAHFLEAERLAKFDWKDNRLMIAKCKIALNEYGEAIQWLEKAKTSRTTSLDEKIDVEIEDLIKKYEKYR